MAKSAMQSEEEKRERMLNWPESKIICTLAVPAIISQLVTTLYNAADAYFIGKIDTSASAAIGIALAAMTMIQAVGFFFGQGSGTRVSRLLGKGTEESLRQAKELASTAWFSSLFISAAVLGTALCFLEPLCRLLGSTETMLPYAKQYVGIILAGGPFMATAYTMNQQLRFQGMSLYSMIGIASGGILNVILDPIFIFTFDLGIAGAALATVISQFISFVVMLIGIEKRSVAKISIRFFKPSLTMYKNIANGGLPSLARQSVNGFATAALNAAAGAYGDAAIAAMSIVTKIGSFTTNAMLGFNQGFQPFCGYNYGAGRYDRVKRGFLFAIKAGTAILAVLCVAESIFAPDLVRFFRDDPVVVEIGAQALRYHCMTFWLIATNLTSNALMQTTGKVFKATFLAFIRQGALLYMYLKILVPVWGLKGVQLARCFADSTAFIFCVTFLVITFKEFNELAAKQNAADGETQNA